MLRILFCAVCALISAPAATSLLAVGERLPRLEGAFLSGGTALLPEAASGRVGLLLLGFTYESRFAVEAWTSRFRSQFGRDPRVTFYEIPIIGGMARLGKWFIDSGMRRGTPPTDREHVITIYSNASYWKERVGYRDPRSAYLLLLDRNGVIAWRGSGPVDDTLYRSLASSVEKLLAAE
jgi:hypothetical protein